MILHLPLPGISPLNILISPYLGHILMALHKYMVVEVVSFYILLLFISKKSRSVLGMAPTILLNFLVFCIFSNLISLKTILIYKSLVTWFTTHNLSRAHTTKHFGRGYSIQNTFWSHLLSTYLRGEECDFRSPIQGGEALTECPHEDTGAKWSRILLVFSSSICSWTKDWVNPHQRLFHIFFLCYL